MYIERERERQRERERKKIVIEKAGWKRAPNHTL